jgi:hypothetical protein
MGGLVRLIDWSIGKLSWKTWIWRRKQNNSYRILQILHSDILKELFLSSCTKVQSLLEAFRVCVTWCLLWAEALLCSQCYFSTFRFSLSNLTSFAEFSSYGTWLCLYWVQACTCRTSSGSYLWFFTFISWNIFRFKWEQVHTAQLTGGSPHPLPPLTCTPDSPQQRPPTQPDVVSCTPLA